MERREKHTREAHGSLPKDFALTSALLGILLQPGGSNLVVTTCRTREDAEREFKAAREACRRLQQDKTTLSVAAVKQR